MGVCARVSVYTRASLCVRAFVVLVCVRARVSVCLPVCLSISVSTENNPSAFGILHTRLSNSRFMSLIQKKNVLLI